MLHFRLMKYIYRKLQPNTDVLEPFDCGNSDWNGILIETDPQTLNATFFVQTWFFNDPKSGCRFITVLSAENTYQHCNFKRLAEPAPDDETVLMFFDMNGITRERVYY